MSGGTKFPNTVPQYSSAINGGQTYLRLKVLRREMYAFKLEPEVCKLTEKVFLYLFTRSKARRLLHQSTAEE